MTLAKAREITRLKIEQFKLDHWKVSVRFSKTLKADEGCDGQIEWQPEYRTACITLDKCQSDECIRETIIHELMHLLLEGHKCKASKYDPQYEFGLNVLSELL